MNSLINVLLDLTQEIKVDNFGCHSVTYEGKSEYLNTDISIVMIYDFGEYSKGFTITINGIVFLRVYDFDVIIYPHDPMLLTESVISLIREVNPNHPILKLIPNPSVVSYGQRKTKQDQNNTSVRSTSRHGSDGLVEGMFLGAFLF